MNEATRRLLEHVGVVHRFHIGAMTDRFANEFTSAIPTTGASGSLGTGPADIHPLMLVSVLGWDPTIGSETLRLDGTGTEDTAYLPLSGLRLVGAGQEVSYHRALSFSTDLYKNVQLCAVESKIGKSGPLLLLTISREFVDASDSLFMMSREALIGRLT